MVFAKLDTSPNGSPLAMAKRHRVPGPVAIRIFAMAGGGERILTLKNWSGIARLDWSADGRSISVSASSPKGMQTLLNVDLHGRAKAVLQEPEKHWAGPFPLQTDGILRFGKPAAARTLGCLKAF